MDDRAVSLKRILVTLDGSNLAETVIPLVTTLAGALKAEVILLHVLEREAPATIHGQLHLTSEAEAEGYLSALAGRLQSTGLEIKVHVHPDLERDVAASIALHAKEEDTDLIVMAAHGHGGFRDFLVGRIPQKVVAQAGKKVLIVPAPARREFSSIRRMMLPVDQAGEAQAAVPIVELLATVCKSEVILMTVVPTPGTVPGTAGVATVFLPGTSRALLNWAEEQARESLAQLAERLRDQGIRVITQVVRGDPSSILSQSTTRFGVDLVVMATHARAGLEGLLAGSVAPRVVGSGLCPVLLLPIPKLETDRS